MPTDQGIDISNYTSPLTNSQLDHIANTKQFCIIGIQDSVKALNFALQLSNNSPNVELQYYLDVPRRDWTVFKWYSKTRVWIDIEQGCYTRVADVDMDLELLDQLGCVPGIYCNQSSLSVLDGPPNPAWGIRPLWYANYPLDGHVPTLAEFDPFHTWTEPEIWQYSSGGEAGINCDLNVRFREDVPIEEPYVTHFTQYFSNGSKWEIDAVPPPGR